MKILYIGHYADGSTSKMRGEYLKKILCPTEFKYINTDIPINSTSKIFRSLGWRYKKGPLIKNINNFIYQNIKPLDFFDLAWIDKGVFIYPEIIQLIKEKSVKLIHFTPDPAFTYHKSSLFYKAIPLYDHCITTKSFEIANYQSNHSNSTIFCTQGYDPEIHKPYKSFEEKKGIVFIGHKEPDREFVISKLIEMGILVKLAGIKWEKVVNRYKNHSNLEYYGKGVFGTDYARIISRSLIGLGFLSKIIPELHTTRTLEIPACGTALITERNKETTSIFSNNEALFFDNPEEVLESIPRILTNDVFLREVTQNGLYKVNTGPYNYRSILIDVLQKANVI